jgi:hypothetical protein
MDFPISQTHASPAYLISAGFAIGVMGGFFGVGGSFIAGPALRLIQMPWNMAVGTDLAHILGKSIVGARKHSVLGNIDFKLGLIMAGGTIVGAETGAQIIEALKRHGNVNLVISVVSIVVYVAVSMLMAVESYKTLRRKKLKSDKPDENAFSWLARRLQRWKVGPMINLPVAGVKGISLWIILGVAYIGGFMSGLLGGGAGYIRLPAMIYLLGVPTHLAVGTDLFEVIISSSYSTFSHALKGNVDILVALVMHTGAAVGAQIGAVLTQFYKGPKIRMAFVPLPLIGAGIVAWTLLTGKHGH